MAGTKHIAVAVAAVLIIAIAYVYFFIISPAGTKQALEKPAFAPGENVSQKHITWVANELGGYKLQSSAQIEFVVEGQKFSVSSSGGKVVSKVGAASDPDLRITAGRDAFARILSATDTNAEIVALYNEGQISVELLKDQATLALKGYKGLYDTIKGTN